MSLSTQTNDERLGIPAGLFADSPGNNSRLSVAESSWSNASAEPYAKIFGLSLAALWAAYLVLNAASPSMHICQKSDRDFGTTSTDSASASKRIVLALGGGWRAEPFEMIRSKECAENERGAEPGY
jgi:hypothetical protein